MSKAAFYSDFFLSWIAKCFLMVVCVCGCVGALLDTKSHMRTKQRRNEEWCE